MSTKPQLADASAPGVILDADGLRRRYHAVRQASQALTAPLEIEDYCIQSMPDASPAKWHLAHTSWFFETFLLRPHLPEYRSPHAQYAILFNSYYHTVGQQHARPFRGILSRPTVDEVMAYRRHVDQHMDDLFEQAADELDATLAALIETGLHHEQQHQELILMDIKHAFWCNPLRPAYRPCSETVSAGGIRPLNWLPYHEQMTWIGHVGHGFAFDNEMPRHRTFVDNFQLADRLVTCGEYLEFIEQGGYRQPQWWLSDGWIAVQAHDWDAPLYWERDGSRWQFMTLGGMRPLQLDEPVSHVSFYEADAYARWRGCWLPREAAWEMAAVDQPVSGNFVESGALRPLPVPADAVPNRPAQMFGDLWEWTCSPYSPYPGYRAPSGALGEYNGKFMCNQLVLRGGSYGTPASHVRPSYRNFFPADARWPFTGIRLAKELNGD